MGPRMQRVWGADDGRRGQHLSLRINIGIGRRRKLARVAHGVVWLLVAIGRTGAW